MIELIERLEKATGPDRELDGAIARALDPGATLFIDCMVYETPRGWHPPQPAGPPPIVSNVPRYTGSTDAALGLVPAEYAWSVQSSAQFPGQAWLYPPDNYADIQYHANGKTPALAICIACLKARTAMKTGQTLAASESG